MTSGSVRSASTGGAGEPWARVAQFLEDALDETSLRRLVLHSLGPSAARKLPGRESSVAMLAQAVVELLVQMDALGPVIFEWLVDEVPCRKEEIAELRRIFAPSLAGQSRERTILIVCARGDFVWAKWISWHLHERGYTPRVQILKKGDTLGDLISDSCFKVLVLLSRDLYTVLFSAVGWEQTFLVLPRRLRERITPVLVRPLDVVDLGSIAIRLDNIHDEDAAVERLLLATEDEKFFLRRPNFPDVGDSIFSRVRARSKPIFPGKVWMFASGAAFALLGSKLVGHIAQISTVAKVTAAIGVAVTAFTVALAVDEIQGSELHVHVHAPVRGVASGLVTKSRRLASPRPRRENIEALPSEGVGVITSIDPAPQSVPPRSEEVAPLLRKKEAPKHAAPLTPIGRVMSLGIYTPNPSIEALGNTVAAQFLKRDGVSKVSFCVDTNGRTHSVRVKQPFPGDVEVDKICVSTVESWTFRPFRVGGHPVETCTTVEFDLKFRESAGR